MGGAVVELSTHAKERATAIGETDDKIAEAPGALRKALLAKADDASVKDVKDDLLKAAEQSDMWLLRFCRVRKYDMDAAVTNVIGWFRWKNVQQNLSTDLVEAFGGTNAVDTQQLDYWTVKAADVQDVIEHGGISFLPGYTKRGAKAMCISDVADLIKLMQSQPIQKTMIGMNYMMEQMSLDPNTQLCGLAMVYDMENYSIALLKSLAKRKDFMELQKKKAAAMNDAYPFRFAEMYMVDCPWYFRVLWAIIRLFLKRKLRDRIHMISKASPADLAKLLESFEPSQLPTKFGGTLSDEQMRAGVKAWLAERIDAEKS